MFKGYEIIVIVKFNDGLFVGFWQTGWHPTIFLAMMLHFVIARTEACPYQRIVMSLPHSSVPQEGHVATVLRSPHRLMRETLAGVITALALIPEVISFSVVAGVDPKVSLIASVVLCFALSLLGGRPAMVTAAAGSVALVIGPMVHQHGVQYILPAVVMAGLIQILFGALGMARLMRFIPQSVMTGFVNALGILIFFAQVPHFWSRSPLIAIVLLTLFTVTSGQILPTVGDEGSMGGGLPGFTQLLVPLNLETLSIIWPCALSIAFVGLLESLLTAKLVDELTATPSSKRRESIGLGVGNIMAGFYGGIAGCAMIGQTIVNVEMGKGRSRISTLAAGIVLLVLVTALSEVMAKIPMAVLAGIMAIVAVKTFSWHSVQPVTLKNAPVAETVVMLVTVVATVSTGNLAVGVLGGIVMMFILPARLKQKALATEEKSSPVQEK